MLDWTAIDTVLLDMDGTLLDLHFDNFFWLEYLPLRYAEQHSLPLPVAKARLEGFFGRAARQPELVLPRSLEPRTRARCRGHQA